MDKISGNKNDKDALIWKEGTKKELLKTVVMSVTSVPSTAPDGSHGDYIVMDAKDWVVIIPVQGKDFLMVKQWRHGEKALSIEFPGGVIENGEAPEIAAARELKEETGFTAGKLVHLATMNPNPALFSNHVHAYAAFDLKDSGSQNLDDDEFVQYMKIPQKEVYEKMGTGEYCHALMASALCLYRQYDEKHPANQNCF